MKEPKYCLHKVSGRGYIFKNGRNVYLPGAYGSPESRAAYYRELAEWTANGGGFHRAPSDGKSFTIGHVVDDYRSWAQKSYMKNGHPTTEFDNIDQALCYVEGVPEQFSRGKKRKGGGYYRDMPANDFGPRQLDIIIDAMIRNRRCRQTINADIRRIKRCFKHALKYGMIAPETWLRIDTVGSIKKGFGGVREGKKVAPAAEGDIEALKPFVSRQVWAMMQLQLRTGMRAGEVTNMRACDLDMSGDLWVYNIPPDANKTGHVDGVVSEIYLGPLEQEIIKPFLPDPALVLKHPWVKENHLFTPAAAYRELLEARRAARKTPVQPSQQNRRKKKPRKAPGSWFTTDSYAQAIRNACKRAGVKLTSHQLRHTAATKAREEYGIEAAQALLRHKSLKATEIYAERSKDMARKLAENRVA